MGKRGWVPKRHPIEDWARSYIANTQKLFEAALLSSMRDFMPIHHGPDSFTGMAQFAVSLVSAMGVENGDMQVIRFDDETASVVATAEPMTGDDMLRLASVAPYPLMYIELPKSLRRPGCTGALVVSGKWMRDHVSGAIDRYVAPRVSSYLDDKNMVTVKRELLDFFAFDDADTRLFDKGIRDCMLTIVRVDVSRSPVDDPFSYSDFMGNDGDALSDMYLDYLRNLTSFVCAVNGRLEVVYTPSESTGSKAFRKPNPKKRPCGVALVKAGFTMGEQIRPSSLTPPEEPGVYGEPTSSSGPRKAHWRRAHWQYYWCGKRGTPDYHPELRFVGPVFVSGTAGSQPSVTGHLVVDA